MTSISEDMQKLKSLCIAGGHVKQNSQDGSNLVDPKKV
jgi:hypothetical protein